MTDSLLSLPWSGRVSWSDFTLSPPSPWRQTSARRRRVTSSPTPPMGAPASEGCPDSRHLAVYTHSHAGGGYWPFSYWLLFQSSRYISTHTRMAGVSSLAAVGIRALHLDTQHKVSPWQAMHGRLSWKSGVFSFLFCIPYTCLYTPQKNDLNSQYSLDIISSYSGIYLIAGKTGRPLWTRLCGPAFRHVDTFLPYVDLCSQHVISCLFLSFPNGSEYVSTIYLFSLHSDIAGHV